MCLPQHQWRLLTLVGSQLFRGCWSCPSGVSTAAPWQTRVLGSQQYVDGWWRWQMVWEALAFSMLWRLHLVPTSLWNENKGNRLRATDLLGESLQRNTNLTWLSLRSIYFYIPLQRKVFPFINALRCWQQTEWEMKEQSIYQSGWRAAVAPSNHWSWNVRGLRVRRCQNSRTRMWGPDYFFVPQPILWRHLE